MHTECNAKEPIATRKVSSEFSKYVVFLGSPTNAYVTGQSLLVDGGLTCSL